jgi:hypothetical protein
MAAATAAKARAAARHRAGCPAARQDHPGAGVALELAGHPVAIGTGAGEQAGQGLKSISQGHIHAGSLL